MLVDGTCATCKYGAVDPAIDATVDTACTLLESQDSTAIITRSNESVSYTHLDVYKRQR